MAWKRFPDLACRDARGLAGSRRNVERHGLFQVPTGRGLVREARTGGQTV